MTTLHIRDTATGQFYAGTDYIPSPTSPQVVPKYAKRGMGKAFLELGKIKVHINYLIGTAMPPKWMEEKVKRRWSLPHKSEAYQNAVAEIEAWEMLHPGYAEVPEFLYNPCAWESVPDTWEVVALHNREKGEQEVLDFGPAAYAAQMQRLRRLTDHFGVAVKDVFRRVETKGLLEEYRWVAVIGPDLHMLRQEEGWWNRMNVFRPDVVKVDEALKQMGMKRTQVIRAAKEFNIALAFRTLPDALMFKLTYSGEMRANVVDMAKLEQVVDAAEVSL